MLTLFNCGPRLVGLAEIHLSSSMKSPSSTRSLCFAIVLCTFAALSAPAQRLGAQTAKPFEALSVSAQAMRDSVVQMARAQIGRRYRTGGETPEKMSFGGGSLLADAMKSAF